MPKCECPEKAYDMNLRFMYCEEEYKAMVHEPNECLGDYMMMQYQRGDQILWLCSCCCLSGDIPVENNA